MRACLLWGAGIDSRQWWCSHVGGKVPHARQRRQQEAPHGVAADVREGFQVPRSAFGELHCNKPDTAISVTYSSFQRAHDNTLLGIQTTERGHACSMPPLLMNSIDKGIHCIVVKKNMVLFHLAVLQI